MDGRRKARRSPQAVPARLSRRRAILVAGGAILAGTQQGRDLVKFTVATAYGEVVKELAKRGVSIAIAPAATPTPSPPPPQTVPPCPPLDLVVDTIATKRTPCGPNNYITVEFDADRPPPGWTYWTFATAESGIRWFPSLPPRWIGGRRYVAELVTGSDPRYTVFVFALDSAAAKSVQDYVDARAGKGKVKGDGEWFRGLNLTDLGGCHLQKGSSLVPGPCAA